MQTCSESGGETDPTSFDEGGHAALHKAAIKDDWEKIEHLVKEKSLMVDSPSEYQETPLQMACLNGSVAAARLLLELQADARAVDGKGNTVLHHSAAADSHQLIELLVNTYDCRDLLNEANKDEDTAAHCAARLGCESAMKALKRLEADLTIKNKYGCTAHEIAIQSNNVNTANASLSVVPGSSRRKGERSKSMNNKGAKNTGARQDRNLGKGGDKRSMPNVAMKSQKDPLQDSHTSQNTEMQRTLSARHRTEGSRQSMPNVALKKHTTQGPLTSQSATGIQMQRTLSARYRRDVGSRQNMPNVAVKSQKAFTQDPLTSHSATQIVAMDSTLPAYRRKEGSGYSTPDVAARSQKAPVRDSHTSQSATDIETSAHSRSETSLEDMLKSGSSSNEPRLTLSGETEARHTPLDRAMARLDPRRSGSYKLPRRRREGAADGTYTSTAITWQRSQSDKRPQRSQSDAWKTERSNTLV